jgi:Sulfotransferase family
VARSAIRRVRASAPVTLAGDYLSSTVEGFRQREAFGAVRAYVMFVGYGRSGHTLVSELLNAHPDSVISRELHALRYVQAGFRRGQLFGMILTADRRFGGAQRTAAKTGYSYTVQNQWQGRFRVLRVIGDKRAGLSTVTLGRKPELLDRLRKLVRVPVKVLHVVRNPFDNITTMALRSAATLSSAADEYFGLCDAVARIRTAVDPADWLDVRHEDVIADPTGSLRVLLGFVGLEADDQYLRDCASIVYGRPHLARLDASWPVDLIEDVQRRMAAHPALAGYAYDDGEAAASSGSPGPRLP